MFNLFSGKTKNYKSLNGKEFKHEYDARNHPVLIDVRTAAEFASGSISKAKNIDLLSLEFKKQIHAMDKSKDYFIFCRSGNRSAQACGIMAELGFNVYNLKGGVGMWPR